MLVLLLGSAVAVLFRKDSKDSVSSTDAPFYGVAGGGRNNPDSPLLQAAKQGGEEGLQATQKLLDEGADAKEVVYTDWDTRHRFGDSPLKAACRYGHADVARLLLENGADPDLALGESKESVLHVAAMGKPAIVELLLEFKANPDIENKCGRFCRQTPLCHVGSNIAIAKMLLNAGANPSRSCGNNNGSILYQAVDAENLEMVELLLEAGANPNVKSPGPQRRSMLHEAAYANNKHGTQKEIMHALLAHGADPKDRDVLRVVKGDRNADLRAVIKAHNTRKHFAEVDEILAEHAMPKDLTNLIGSFDPRSKNLKK